MALKSSSDVTVQIVTSRPRPPALDLFGAKRNSALRVPGPSAATSGHIASVFAKM
jgi:hypothetical protein